MARKKPAAISTPVERAQREFEAAWACLGRWCGDDARYAMHSIKVDGPLMWATDGKALLRVELNRVLLSDGLYDPKLGAKRLASGLLPEGEPESKDAGWFPPVAEIWQRLDHDYASGTTVPLLAAFDPIYIEEIGKTGKALAKACGSELIQPVIVRTPREYDRSWSRENPNRCAVEATAIEFSLPPDTELLLSVRALLMPILLGDDRKRLTMPLADTPAKAPASPESGAAKLGASDASE